ncbi:MAG: ABC transporter ATP-binding protein [Chloroflexi bacterium]|nr:ABC transporter ATP-binding protein [Chloroflexota bacterium]
MILRLDNVHTYYGLSHILQGISLEIGEGEVVALLGRNGAGKSTTLKTIMGLAPAAAGVIQLKGKELRGLKPFQINRLGIGYVPETRGIFSYLTALENLRIAENPRSRWTLQDVLEKFPKLQEVKDRRGRNLSGGEQQMVAIARALLTGPEVLLLDEPSQGLAPVIVETVLEIIEGMKTDRLSMLLVEQSLDIAADLADRCYVIDQGVIVFEGKPKELVDNTEVTSKYLGVGV